MTSILTIIERGKLLEQSRHGLTAQRDGHGVELQYEPPILDLREDQIVAPDDFVSIMSRHRQAHFRVRRKQLTSGAL